MCKHDLPSVSVNSSPDTMVSSIVWVATARVTSGSGVVCVVTLPVCVMSDWAPVAVCAKEPLLVFFIWLDGLVCVLVWHRCRWWSVYFLLCCRCRVRCAYSWNLTPNWMWYVGIGTPVGMVWKFVGPSGGLSCIASLLTCFGVSCVGVLYFQCYVVVRLGCRGHGILYLDWGECVHGWRGICRMFSLCFRWMGVLLPNYVMRIMRALGRMCVRCCFVGVCRKCDRCWVGGCLKSGRCWVGGCCLKCTSSGPR